MIRRVTVKEILQATSAPGKRSLIQKAYTDFAKKCRHKLVTVSTTLPYPYNEERPFFAFHFKIESESTKGLLYDVVYQILGDRIEPHVEVRVYNNCPAFVYFLAYVFHKRDSLLFPQLYSLKVLTSSPKKTNPKYLIDPDRYTYAALYLAKRYKIRRDNVESFRKTEWSIIRTPEEIERARKLLQYRKR